MRRLLGRRVQPPRTLLAALGVIFEDVSTAPSVVRVIEHSWLARLHGRAIATTRWRRIYLRGRAADFFADPELMLHEYCHVLLQWESGRLTRSSYLSELLRRGYFLNSYEVEARRFARSNLERLRAELARASGSSSRGL